MGSRRPNTATRLGRGQSTKRWSAEFSEHRRTADRLFQDTLKAINNKRGALAAFLQDFQSSVPSRQVEKVKTFFDNVRPQYATTISPNRAWVDYRRELNGQSLCKSTWLTSSQVAEVLELQVRTTVSEYRIQSLLTTTQCLGPTLPTDLNRWLM
jgi:hypothetical protein